ncbi:hypothetical protein LZL87_000302 [Fusarium oxysporum]|nr:hypothetical protein LZL87_000302 [Fusarium oxysporum]
MASTRFPQLVDPGSEHPPQHACCILGLSTRKKLRDVKPRVSGDQVRLESIAVEDYLLKQETPYGGLVRSSGVAYGTNPRPTLQVRGKSSIINLPTKWDPAGRCPSSLHAPLRRAGFDNQHSGR